MHCGAMRTAEHKRQRVATTGHVEAVVIKLLCAAHMQLRGSLYRLEQGLPRAAPADLTAARILSGLRMLTWRRR